MHIFADSFTKMTLSNGNLRITLTQNGPDNQILEVGTLIVPANRAGHFVSSLTNSLKQLDEQIKAQAEAKDQITQ